MMDKERLIALHTLSVITVIGGFLALFVSWVLAITIMPLHIYFAVHGARAAGAGRLASAAIALVAALPLVNTLMLVVVSLISLLVHVFSTDYVAGDRRYTHYFAFLSLFTASMLFFVISSSTLQMIVGWELVGLCSFALIGHWWEEKPNSDAALKAFLVNRCSNDF